MTRPGKTDMTLDQLNDERDHQSIQINLAAHAETPDTARLAILRDKMIMLERRISNYRPADS